MADKMTIIGADGKPKYVLEDDVTELDITCIHTDMSCCVNGNHCDECMLTNIFGPTQKLHDSVKAN